MNARGKIKEDSTDRTPLAKLIEIVRRRYMETRSYEAKLVYMREYQKQRAKKKGHW